MTSREEKELDLLKRFGVQIKVAELIKTKNGLRGFFAYALSDQDCYLLDKLPFSVVFKFQEGGNDVVEIIVKNLIMSSAQVVAHERENNLEYKSNSENISERCKSILRVLDTKSVTKNINQIMNDLDNLGNSFDNSKKYDDKQKEFIKYQIFDIAQ
ncbi:hypothetical protein OA981_02755 [Prochlorococcus sp. AH-716-A09]|nr:hypothetical protein [Prochlorococcus sp. AH-716-A09]